MQASTPPLQLPDSGQANRLRVSVGALSVQGARRTNNEDQQYVSPSRDLFIVADGMGGHAAGEVASRFAIDVIAHDLAQMDTVAGDDEIETRVQEALDRAHCMIAETSVSESHEKRSGSTVVLALLRNHRLYVAGVGDSRAYLIREGSVQRLTTDDTWPEALVQMGRITVDQARKHWMRHCLLNALGMTDFDAAQEEVHVLDVYGGDRYLLASDGLTDVIDDARLAQIVGGFDNPQKAAEELARIAQAEGGGDDITCIVFHVIASCPAGQQVGKRPRWWSRWPSFLPGVL